MSHNAALSSPPVARLREVKPADEGDGPPANELTIDDLAREMGLSVRNVRSHQARGLLPAPEVRGRIGYYGPEHVNRLRLIQELQTEGMKLEGIRRLLKASAGRGDGLLRVKQAADSMADSESPEVVSADELRERLQVEGEEGAKLVSRAIKLDLLVPLGEGLFEVPSPALLRVAEDLVAQGISVRAALRLVEDLRRHSRAVSQRFVKLFIDEVWRPFVDAGMPEEQWSAIADSMEAARPLAAEAVLAVFRQTLSDEVESAFADITRRLSEGKR
jgi:DNA-binding transcriptional MerR regulator